MEIKSYGKLFFIFPDLEEDILRKKFRTSKKVEIDDLEVMAFRMNLTYRETEYIIGKSYFDSENKYFWFPPQWYEEEKVSKLYYIFNQRTKKLTFKQVILQSEVLWLSMLLKMKCYGLKRWFFKINPRFTIT